MTIDFDRIEFAENPEPRCPCILLLDTSSSMDGKPIDELNNGLKAFRDALLVDSLAMLRVEVAIITFGPVTVKQDFITAEQFTPPTLTAANNTPMGGAIDRALDMLAERKVRYRQAGLSHFRPWIFLVTDGAPTDEWKAAAERVKAAEKDKKVAFFAVGVSNANMNTLNQITSRKAIHLNGMEFREMFLWLSSSLSGVTRMEPDVEEVPLQSPLGWGTL